MSQILAMRSTKAATETYRDALALAYVMLLGRYILMFLLVVFDARDCAPERNMAGFLMDREVQLSLAAKNEAVGRASIVEHSQLFAAFHSFALLDGDLARRHLNHAHCDETHQSDIRVVGFDEDEGPGGDSTEVCLGGSENGIIVPQGRQDSREHNKFLVQHGP